MRVLTLLLTILCLGPSGAADAHGVFASVETETAQALRFGYSDGTPMSYAETLVFGPGDAPDAEFANGRTDIRGRFAFVPDRPGPWRVVASDGMGHRAETTIQVAESMDRAAAPPAQTAAVSGGTGGKAAFGLSLLANLFLAATLLRRKAR